MSQLAPKSGLWPWSIRLGVWHSINHPCLTEISVWVVCVAIPRQQQRRRQWQRQWQQQEEAKKAEDILGGRALKFYRSHFCVLLWMQCDQLPPLHVITLSLPLCNPNTAVLPSKDCITPVRKVTKVCQERCSRLPYISQINSLVV